MTSLVPVIWAMTAMANLTIAAFFSCFWRRTHERLFGWFALAFVFFGVNGVWLALIAGDGESRHLAYIARLAGFGLIVAGVIDKNRGGR